MKQCPSCGQWTDDDSQEFCVRCGAYYVKSPTGRPIPLNQDLPSDPVSAGCILMDAGRFSEAIGAWRGALDEGLVLDITEYNRVLDSTIGCIVSTVIHPNEYVAAAIPDFARMMPDREFIPDLMKRIIGSVDVCMIQNGVLGLANPYLMLFSDCFVVYPDLRDVLDECNNACDAFSVMVDKASKLPVNDAKGVPPMKWLEAYGDCAFSIRDAVSDAVSSHTSDELDALTDAWSSAPALVYLDDIRVAMMFNARAVTSGRLTRGMMIRSRNAHISKYVSRYLKG